MKVVCANSKGMLALVRTAFDDCQTPHCTQLNALHLLAARD